MSAMEPTVTIDFGSGMAYVKVSDAPISETIDTGDAFLVDVDNRGAMVGLEIFNLDAEIPLADLRSRYQLSNAAVDAIIRVRPDVTTFVARSNAEAQARWGDALKPSSTRSGEWSRSWFVFSG